jgi:uridine nucleosidase
VLNAPVMKTMIPINVTHTAIVTHDIHSKILGGSAYNGFCVPHPISNLRYTLSTLITFFADTYKHTFGFNNGPPLHDALTIAYIAHPEFFACRRYHVDVELSGTHSLGQTVVDIWNYSGSSEDRWGPDGKNCLVAESLDVRNLTFRAGPQPLTATCTLRFQNSSNSSWSVLITVTPSHLSTDWHQH